MVALIPNLISSLVDAERPGDGWPFAAITIKTIPIEVVTTKVCGSPENLVRELLKGAGLNYGSSHSGRRTLVTWLDRKGYDLELIQLILGHRNPDMTLEYIDPDLPRIKAAFKSIWSGGKPTPK
jgi:hypothetical protein